MISKTQAEEIAYHQGIAAYNAGARMGDCPYDNPGLKKAWEDGFWACLDGARYF